MKNHFTRPPINIRAGGDGFRGSSLSAALRTPNVNLPLTYSSIAVCRFTKLIIYHVLSFSDDKTTYDLTYKFQVVDPRTESRVPTYLPYTDQPPLCFRQNLVNFIPFTMYPVLEYFMRNAICFAGFTLGVFFKSNLKTKYFPRPMIHRKKRDE